MPFLYPGKHNLPRREVYLNYKQSLLKRYVFYIFFLFCACFRLDAQEFVRYSFTHYGPSAGLGSNEVTSAVQDHDGYIWIGGISGLQRFDGFRFLNFRHEEGNSKSIPGKYVQQLLVDKKHRLWMCVGETQVGYMDTRTLEYHDVPIETKEHKGYINHQRYLVEDNDGNIILIYIQGEYVTLDENTQRFSYKNNFLNEPAGWLISDLVQIPGTKKYWIGTNQGLVLFDRSSGMMSYAGHNLAKDPMLEAWGTETWARSFLLDHQDRLWFYNWKLSIPQVYCWDIRNKKPVLDGYNFFGVLKSYHEFNELIEQKDGTIWLRGLNVFARYRENEKRFQPVYNVYENEQSIYYSNVQDLMEDREGNLWVCTNNNGVYRFNPSSQFFTNVRPRNRGTPTLFSDGGMMSFTEMKDGTLLAGSWGTGLYHFDRNLNMIPLNIRGIGEVYSPSMWDICRSRDSNTIWMGSQPGIYRLDEKKRQATFYNPPALGGRTVRQLREDRFGNLWVGTQSLGLWKWTASKGKSDFNAGLEPIRDVDSTLIHRIRVDSKGYVWVTTMGKGVYMIDPATNRTLAHFGLTETGGHKLPSNNVPEVMEYDDSTMVIAVDGLFLVDRRTKRITREIRLPQSVVSSIAAIERDSNGYIWMGTTAGIYRVSLKTEIFIHFDRLDGIANDYFTQAASYKMADGRMVFGVDNQFLIFDPNRVRIDMAAPKMEITGLLLMNDRLLLDSLNKRKKVEFSPDENSVSFEFSGLVYNGIYIVKYMLEGLDKDWKRADGSNSAIYSYLPPGTYTFKVRSEDAEGRPSETTEFTFHILPPFWKTWWFLGLVVFALTAGLFWLDKLRLRRLKDTESIRTRIATSLTEDMSNSLANINISSELARAKIDADVQRAKEYIGQISDTSNRMVQAMYDMVWSIDPSNDTMADTLDRMKTFAAETENNYPINIDFDVDIKVQQLRLDMEKRYELLSIYKEAMDNACRHSSCRYIKINIRYSNHRLVMMVVDDGKGFVMTEAAMLGRGISDMRRRAGAVQAILYVESEINTGTVVKLDMPV